jgi:hypothetical protein
MVELEKNLSNRLTRRAFDWLQAAHRADSQAREEVAGSNAAKQLLAWFALSRSDTAHTAKPLRVMMIYDQET